MKKQIYLTLFALASALTFVGCNKSSDALREYKDVNIGLKTDKKSETQHNTYDPFIIKIAGSNDESNANFIEGEPGEVLFQVKSTSTTVAVAEYDLIVSQFYYAEQLSLARTENPEIFSVKWTPQIGFLPPGKNNATIEIRVRARVLGEGPLKAIVSEEKTFNLFVSRENRTPKILGYSGLSKAVEEGSGAVKFSVDIDDPSSLSSGVPPELNRKDFDSKNIEGFRANAIPFIKLDDSQKENPKQNPDGKGRTTWRKYYVLDIEKMPVKLDRLNKPDPKADSVQICFEMAAESFNGSRSLQQQVCFEGRYSAQTPSLAWLESQIVDVKSKETVTLKFETKSSNGLGQITTPTSQQLSALIGTKEISCQNTEASLPSQKLCEIKWTPPCVKESQTVKLDFKVVNKISNKTKASESLVRSFKIQPDEVACPVPVKKPVTKPDVKPAVKPDVNKMKTDKKETK